MVTKRTPTGRLLVFNAFSHTLDYPDLFLAFVSDDDEHSRVESIAADFGRPAERLKW